MNEGSVHYFLGLQHEIPAEIASTDHDISSMVLMNKFQFPMSNIILEAYKAAKAQENDVDKLKQQFSSTLEGIDNFILEL